MWLGRRERPGSFGMGTWFYFVTGRGGRVCSRSVVQMIDLGNFEGMGEDRKSSEEGQRRFYTVIETMNI